MKISKKDVLIWFDFFRNCLRKRKLVQNMYIARQGYISPIWSRELTLKFMKIADEENWDIAVHDCSNYTKFAIGLNLNSKEGMWFGASNYICEFFMIPNDDLYQY